VNDWIVRIIGEMGVVGVALLMAAENIFPPLPSEVIMPLAGYLSTRGQIDFWTAVVAGTLGSVVGATFWYLLGRRMTRDQLCALVERRGVWLAMTPHDVDRAIDWFHGHGRFSVMIGRMVPLVRTLISVPAGLSGMPLPRFLVLSTIGSAAWTGALAYGGRFLGQRFEQIEQWVAPVTWAVIAIAMVSYLVRVARIRRAARAEPG
jgi:membrane protein DedA with SNARE-associated domain